MTARDDEAPAGGEPARGGHENGNQLHSTTAPQAHELARLFPPMAEAEFVELKRDILNNGQRDLIVMLDGLVLDGWHRHRACTELGLAPRTIAFEKLTPRPKDPLSFVLSKNLVRRHLTESQRAMVADKLATMRQGARTDLAPTGAKSQADAAKTMGVSRRSVQRAHKVRSEGVPAVAEAVLGGTLSLREAERVVEVVPVEHQAVVVSLPPGERRVALDQAAPPDPAPDAAEPVPSPAPAPAAPVEGPAPPGGSLPPPECWPAIWDGLWNEHDMLRPEVTAGLEAIARASSERVPRKQRPALARRMTDLARETGRFNECHVVTIVLELTSTYLMAEEWAAREARDKAEAAAREAERWTCPECEKTYRGTELVELYECGECGETFNAEENGNRCESCNKFGSKLTDDGCPKCSVECERAEEAGDHAEGVVVPDAASEPPENQAQLDPKPAPTTPSSKRKRKSKGKPRPGRRVDS